METRGAGDWRVAQQQWKPANAAARGIGSDTRKTHIQRSPEKR